MGAASIYLLLLLIGVVLSIIKYIRGKEKKEITFSLETPDNDQGRRYITIYGLQTGSVNDDIDNNYMPLPKKKSHLEALSDD